MLILHKKIHCGGGVGSVCVCGGGGVGGELELCSRFIELPVESKNSSFVYFL